jgi:hypothetical protein
MSQFDFQHLRDSFTYYPETGTLIRNSNGKPMTGLDAYGYVQLGYRKKMYKAHRLIWAIVHGEFPCGHIDHINGNRSDNRISNLRVVTHQENGHNQQKMNKRNTSGYAGVCWHKRLSKWQAGICVDNSYLYLGVFPSAEEAHASYLAAKRIYHPTAPAN